MNRSASFFMIGAAVVLAGCAERKNPFARTLPDETQVLASPNLALPPNFELRPPRTGEANEALLRGPAAASVSGTGAESWLVKEAQKSTGTVADPTIRQALEAQQATEQATEKAEDKGLIRRWLGR